MREDKRYETCLRTSRREDPSLVYFDTRGDILIELDFCAIIFLRKFSVVENLANRPSELEWPVVT